MKKRIFATADEVADAAVREVAAAIRLNPSLVLGLPTGRTPLRLYERLIAWERAGRIWYRALASGTLPSTAEFTTFANATLSAAESEYGEGSEEVDAVRAGWTGVGVLEDGQDEARSA